MEKLRNFIVTVHNGKPSFRSEYHRQLFWKFFAQYEGQEIAISIDPRKLKRTEKQNSFYWLYLNRIAEYNGDEAEYIHEWAKEKCHPRGVKEKVIFGEKIKVTFSTTNLNKDDFSEYIKKIEKKTGVKAPDTKPFGLPMLHSEYEHMVEEGIIT